MMKVDIKALLLGDEAELPLLTARGVELDMVKADDVVHVVIELFPAITS